MSPGKETKSVGHDETKPIPTGQQVTASTRLCDAQHPEVKVKVKVKLSLCFSLTVHHAVKAYWGSGGIDPCILDLGTRWR
jgi:hypothetical protein